jgi:prevent-host-death family protein
MAALKEVTISNLRKSLKAVLDNSEKAIVVTRKGVDIAVIMNAKSYNEIRELLNFANILASR